LPPIGEKNEADFSIDAIAICRCKASNNDFRIMGWGHLLSLLLGKVVVLFLFFVSSLFTSHGLL